MKKNQEDKVILVNEKDRQIGVMDKVEAHRGKGKLHRAISVYLFNKKNQLLIQQRSSKKIVGAHQWANTVCGNVRPGESYEDCASRRLKEELGIKYKKLKLKPIYKFQYQVKCNEEFSENEIDQVFFGFYDGKTDLNPNEVQKVSWVDWQRLLNAELNLDLAPWFTWMLKDKKLTSLISSFLQ